MNTTKSESLPDCGIGQAEPEFEIDELVTGVVHGSGGRPHLRGEQATSGTGSFGHFGTDSIT